MATPSKTGQLAIAKGKELKRLALLAFKHGPGYFLKRGYSVEDWNAFITRPVVRFEMELLTEEFGRSEETFSKVRFAAHRKLSTQADAAIRLLREAVKGPEYRYEGKGKHRKLVIGKHGPIVKRPEPTRNQLRAAMAVLDYVGVMPDKVDAVTQVTPPKRVTSTVLSDDAVSAAAGRIEGDSVADRAYSREKVRQVVAKVLTKFEGKGSGTGAAKQATPAGPGGGATGK